jgi:hypothetical protein
MSGPLTPSGKADGQWAVYTRDQRGGSTVESIWYLDGDRVAEGEWAKAKQ